jgi:predicted ATP-grasp superfamily ATP-dependent carboligase
MRNPLADATVPAVVVRGEVNGLGVLRSLAKGGVPAVIVDTTLRHAGMWSRFGRRRIFKQLSGRPFVDALIALQSELRERPVLILTDEMAVYTASDFRDELAQYYRFHLPSADMVRRLLNKAEFHEFALANGLPVPRALIIERETDIETLATFGMPVVVKPADKRPVYFGQVERINWIDKIDEAAAACRRMLTSGGKLVVQEWIDGPDSSIYFALFQRDAAAGSRHIFIGRKIAAHPPGVGSTAICAPAEEAAAPLCALTETFLNVTGYHGLGSLEFKWDARARRFVIIEPTVGRTDWQEEIATLNGLNLPLIAYCDALGLPAPIPAPTAAASRRAVWRHSFLHRGGADAAEQVYDGYFRRDDPLPALVFCIDLGLRVLRRLMTWRFTWQWFERRSAQSRTRRIAETSLPHGGGLWRRSKP